MGVETNEIVISGIVNNDSVTITKGEPVKATGEQSASGVAHVGAAKFDAPVGEPITVVRGRCAVKTSGSPAAGAEITPDGAGAYKAAIGGSIVVGTLLEEATASNNNLAIAWLEGPGYIKA